MDVEQAEPLPEHGSLLAKIDQLRSLQDYPPFGPCLRLIGITQASFDQGRFNADAGCWTFLIDLGWSDVTIGPADWPAFNQAILYGGLPLHWDTDAPGQWLRIDYRLAAGPSGSYAYALFADQEPRYLDIERIAFQSGPAVDGVAAKDRTLLQSSAGRDVTLTAFHVGQGMCSLMSDGETGFLLDAGAGKPIRRPDYRQGSIANDLRPAVASIPALCAIVSHADSDHWRLLDWDRWLLDRLQAVYLPDGAPALAFKSPAIKPKVAGLRDAAFTLGYTGTLCVYRADPSTPDSNGDCLVACADIDRRKALLPGDYVYSRMRSDRRKDYAIQNLASGTFDAVVVPHHGDKASALGIVKPLRPHASIAFFSAGDHDGYRHPTTESLDNHREQGFAIVDQHWLPDIRSKRLLP